MQKKSFFLISGIISFSFYIFLCFIIIFYLTKPSIKEFTPKIQSTVLELDVIVEKSDKKRIEKKEDKKIVKEEIIVEKATSQSAEKKPDLKSLFANVKTNTKKVATKEINNVEKSIDPKRFKSKFEKEKKSSNVKLDKLLNDKKTTTNVKSSSKTKSKENNEYFSKVFKLLDAWVPLVRDDNQISIVLITITPNGKFSYKFKKYSRNNDFNISLKAFLEEQINIVYPKPKLGKSVTIEVEYKTKG